MTTQKTAKSTVTLISENLVRIQINENAEINVDDIWEINSIKASLVGSKKYCVIFIAPSFGMISPEARAASASATVYENAIAKAIIVPNLGTRLISSFFIKFNKPPAPTRIFSSEELALVWLNKMKLNEIKNEDRVKVKSGENEAS